MATFDGRKVVFLHIPKTAGTSVKEFFYQFFSADEICPDWDELALRKNLTQNIDKYRFFHGHFNYEVLKSFPDNTIVFTFLRSPIQQLLSSYHYARTLSDGHIQALAAEARVSALAARSLPLREYLARADAHIAQMLTNIQTRKLANSSNYRIIDANWPWLVEKAIANSETFDFVGLVERIDTDIARLVSKFDLTPRHPLEKRNASRSEQADVDKETRHLAEGFISADNLLYGSWLKKPISREY